MSLGALFNNTANGTGGLVVATSFRSTEVAGCYLHMLPTEQFRTRHLNIKLVHPMTRSDVTSVALLPYLWMEGTEHFPSSRALMQKADDLFGAIVRTGIGKRCDRQVVEAYVSVPEENGLTQAKGLFDAAKNLAMEVLLHPFIIDNAFPVNHVERELALHQKRIESIVDDKIAFAMERCLAETCRGTDAALPRLGFAQDLHALSPQKLYDTHQRLLSESEIHVYIVGQLNETDVIQENILHTLSSTVRNKNPQIHRPLAPLSTDSRSTQTIVEQQNVMQGKLNLGYRTGISYAHPMYPAAMVMNGVLGGFPHSKLFMNVREKASLAYFASSRFDSMTGLVTVQTGIEIAQKDAALEIILRQVDELQKGNITDEELSFTKNGLINQYRQLLDQPTALIDIHFNGVLTKSERDIHTIIDQIHSVSLESVIEAAHQLQLDTIYFLTNHGEGHHEAHSL